MIKKRGVCVFKFFGLLFYLFNCYDDWMAKCSFYPFSCVFDVEFKSFDGRLDVDISVFHCESNFVFWHFRTLPSLLVYIVGIPCGRLQVCRSAILSVLRCLRSRVFPLLQRKLGMRLHCIFGGLGLRLYLRKLLVVRRLLLFLLLWLWLLGLLLLVVVKCLFVVVLLCLFIFLLERL